MPYAIIAGVEPPVLSLDIHAAKGLPVVMSVYPASREAVQDSNTVQSCDLVAVVACMLDRSRALRRQRDCLRFCLRRLRVAVGWGFARPPPRSGIKSSRVPTDGGPAATSDSFSAFRAGAEPDCRAWVSGLWPLVSPLRSLSSLCRHRLRCQSISILSNETNICWRSIGFGPLPSDRRFTISAERRRCYLAVLG